MPVRCDDAGRRDVRLWEGIIARKIGGRYQQAFGHHRIHAAREELGDGAKVPRLFAT